MTLSPTVCINNAQLSYRDTVLFDHVNLTLTGGKWTCLLGPSGIGKSSLLKFIAGIKTDHTECKGEISSDSSTPLHGQIAYMAQTDLLLPWLTVIDNAVLGALLRDTKKEELTHVKETARALLNDVGLTHCESYYPDQLSGGMRQRVALVRTLMENKPVILMDEPFSALDAITRYQLQTLASTLLKNRTVLFVTHDPHEALRLADHIVILQGQPAKLYSPFSLPSDTPRDITENSVVQLQKTLFQELAQAKGIH